MSTKASYQPDGSSLLFRVSVFVPYVVTRVEGCPVFTLSDTDGKGIPEDETKSESWWMERGLSKLV